MAFGSGSSLATDRCSRRRGFPFSLKLCKEGKASGLHHTSSSKPTVQPSFCPAKAISRSRRLFSCILGVGTANPSFSTLPAHPHPRQSGPDGFSADPLRAEPFFEAHLKAAISKVHKLLGLPKSLGIRCSIS